jgi:hypothetical protein
LDIDFKFEHFQMNHDEAFGSSPRLLSMEKRVMPLHEVHHGEVLLCLDMGYDTRCRKE